MKFTLSGFLSSSLFLWAAFTIPNSTSVWTVRSWASSRMTMLYLWNEYQMQLEKVWKKTNASNNFNVRSKNSWSFKSGSCFCHKHHQIQKEANLSHHLNRSNFRFKPPVWVCQWIWMTKEDIVQCYTNKMSLVERFWGQTS